MTKEEYEAKVKEINGLTTEDEFAAKVFELNMELLMAPFSPEPRKEELVLWLLRTLEKATEKAGINKEDIIRGM